MTSIHRPFVATAAAVAFAALASGCASTSSTQEAPSPKAEAPAADTSSTDTGNGPAKMDIGAGSSAKLESVYFATDSPLLTPKARDTLKRNAKAIQAHPEWGALRIEGHCDERGSEEYNLALGERRAGAVKAYLVNLGVPGKRLVTRTFGESVPAVAGHDESAWRYNRRSEFQGEALASMGR